MNCLACVLGVHSCPGKQPGHGDRRSPSMSFGLAGACRARHRVLAGCSVLALGAAFASTVPAAAATGRAGTRLTPVHRIVPRPHGIKPRIITGTMTNHGGPVQTAPRVYVVFWDWVSDPSGEQAYLTRFLSNIGGTSWLGTVKQYGAGAQANLLAGTWSDTNPVPASPSDAQVQAEAAAAASHFGAGNSVNVQIVVATPSGHSTPGFGSSFCAYHGAVSADPNVTYTDLPYMTDAGSACGEDAVNGPAGLLDGVSIVEGHELAEAITDPLLNAWYDASGNEIGDKCAWTGLANLTTTGGSFAVQPLWSNAANGCVLSSPIPPPPAPLLGFVKTASTATGKPEVHIDAYSSGSYHRVLDASTDFSSSDPANGTFELFGSVNGQPELGYIKTANTGSGTVEVHIDAYSSGSYHRVLDTTSDFSPPDRANGISMLFANANGQPELGFVKTANTGSGRPEVHVDAYSSGSYHRVLDASTDFSSTDPANGTFVLFGSVNGQPELGYIKTANTGTGSVEVHIDAYSSGSYHRVLDTTSDFSPADRANGIFMLFGNANGQPQLGFVKTANTGSGRPEVHVDAYSSGSYHRVLDASTDFSSTDPANGTFVLFGSVNGQPELGYIKTANTGTGS